MTHNSTVEIIPSINVQTFAEVQERIKKIESHVQWCHFDVTDGVFSRHPTWRNPHDLAGLRTALKVEVHLMAQTPENILDQWVVPPIMRVIVHLEASSDINDIIERCGKADVEIGLAINPDTPWETLKPWTQKADVLQILAVNPGPSGQEMKPEIVDKVKHLRAYCPACIIEVDGGVNIETARLLRAAGADLLVAGSAIFSARDTTEAITSLQT